VDREVCRGMVNKMVRSKECNHKWIDMEDGSHDKVCVKCGRKAKQATAALLLTIPITTPAIQSTIRETITINIGFNNSNNIACKDNLLKEIEKQLSYNMNNTSALR
jgi:hypothetical protein